MNKDAVYFYCSDCQHTHDSEKETISPKCLEAFQASQDLLAFNLSCTKCTIDSSFDVGMEIHVQAIVDLAHKKHNEEFPDCAGELYFTTQFFTMRSRSFQ